MVVLEMQSILMMNRFQIDYDAKFDTLYVGYKCRATSYGDDSLGDIIILRDVDTDDVTGFTILSFLKKYHNNRLPKLPSEIECSIEKDILPSIQL